MENQQKSGVSCQRQQLSKNVLGNCLTKSGNSPLTVASESQSLTTLNPSDSDCSITTWSSSAAVQLAPSPASSPKQPVTTDSWPVARTPTKVRWKCKQAVGKHLPALGENKNDVNLMLEQDHVPLASGQGMITMALQNKDMKIHPISLTWFLEGKVIDFFR